MMDILPTSNDTPGTPRPTATPQTNEPESNDSLVGATVDDQSEQFDTFLRLLTAQISNQDPLAPIDSTQFVEQLATFSNLELQAAGNQTLESIENLLGSMMIENGDTPLINSADI